MAAGPSSTASGSRDVRFRRHGKRDVVGFTFLIVALVLMSLRAARQWGEDGFGPDDATIIVGILLLVAVLGLVVTFGVGGVSGARTARLRASAPFAVTMAPLGSFWSDLASAFRRPGEKPRRRRRLRTALTFTLTADSTGITLWKGFPRQPDRIAWIDWRDVVGVEAADIADRVYRQPGVVLSVGTAEAPTELTMVVQRDGMVLRRVRDRASIASAVRALEDMRVRALADLRKRR